MTMRTDLGMVRRILRMYRALSYRFSIPTAKQEGQSGCNVKDLGLLGLLHVAVTT